jgi:pimeloyl-ACP methyl ester carboxylesterase
VFRRGPEDAGGVSQPPDDRHRVASTPTAPLNPWFSSKSTGRMLRRVNEGGENFYAPRGDLHVAYQVLGSGPIDVMAFTNGNNVWIDRDGEPHWARFDARLASFTRLIRFDPAGIGLSDPLIGGTEPSVDSWMQDAVAVLTAAGSSRTALFGVAAGSLVPLLLSATYPGRVSSIVLMHGWARLVRAPDYPCGIPAHVLDRFTESVTNPSYAGDSVDDVALSSLTLAGDPQFRSWWKHAGERSASPAIARAIDAVAFRSDLRAVLPMITAPTLVLHRVDNPFVPLGLSRYLADHIPDARLLELPGADHMPFAGDTEELLGEIEEFLTGARSAVDPDRSVATILFTDIVDSTKEAAAAGDRRWRDRLDDHDAMATRQVQRFGGRQVKTTGDGMLAVFEAPARAIQCGLALRHGARQLGLGVRVGIHTC